MYPFAAWTLTVTLVKNLEHRTQENDMFIIWAKQKKVLSYVSY